MAKLRIIRPFSKFSIKFAGFFYNPSGIEHLAVFKVERFKKISEISEHIARLKSKGKTIGFVPTMGALHRGHLSLIEQSVKDNEWTVCSIFVNPTQFNDQKDLENYPRTLESDIKKLRQAGCDTVFTPPVNEMYPEMKTGLIKFDFGRLEYILEGACRPGHFAGVATIVSKFFDIIHPHRAYFGEKDFQQLLIVKKMIEMEQKHVQIIACPIIREHDGLAMSSRNKLLTVQQRKQAGLLYRTLSACREMYGHYSTEQIKAYVKKTFLKHPMFALEYFEIADPLTLNPVEEYADNASVIALIAARIGRVRLIDNMRFNH